MNDKSQTTDPRVLRMTVYPPGSGPYERWEIIIEATGEVLVGGGMPVDQIAARTACSAYHERIETAERAWRATREISNG